MSRPRYKPSYERRKEIEKMNEQLYGNMVKIQNRKNRYFNEKEGPPINHYTAMRVNTFKKIVSDNQKLYDELTQVKPRVITQKECIKHQNRS